MGKGKKIVVVASIIIGAVIIFLGVCVFISYRDSQLSRVYTSAGEELLYSGANRIAEAISLLENALKLDPHNDGAERHLLQAYLGEKQYLNVIAMQTTQIKKDPDDWKNYKRMNRIAEAHIERGEIKEAEGIYESLLTKYRQATGLYLGLSICYEKEGNLAKAIEYEEQAIKIMRDNPQYSPQTLVKREMERLSKLYRKSGDT